MTVFDCLWSELRCWYWNRQWCVWIIFVESEL